MSQNNNNRTTQSKTWKPRWRLFSFSLRSVFVLMTLCCVAMFGKLQWDWYQKKELARQWVQPLVDSKYQQPNPLNPSSLPVCPRKLDEHQQRELLEIAITRLEQSKQGISGLKLFVELYPELARETLTRLLPRMRQAEVRAIALRLISLYRDPSSVSLFVGYLDDEDSRIRSAAVDALGIVHSPSFRIPPLGHGWTGYSPCSIHSDPPIQIDDLIDLNYLGETLPKQRVMGESHIRQQRIQLPLVVRRKIEKVMVSGPSSEERIAAARALVAWPPTKYEFRVAEWGVWISNQGELTLVQSVLDEIPTFVHRTGNSIASLQDRVNQIMIVTKPIIHLSVDKPLAADIEVQITNGRPWFAYPRPDDFSVRVGTVYGRLTSIDTDSKVPTLSDFDRKDLGTLDPTHEGFPWILPAHRKSGAISSGMGGASEIVSLGLRWQSLIVAPKQQPWMNPPKVGKSEKTKWWSELRKVPTSWISSFGESERFLYYDGPTFARTPVDVKLVEKQMLQFVVGEIFPHERYIDFSRNPTTQLSEQESRSSGDSTRHGFYIEVAGEQAHAVFLRLPSESATLELADQTTFERDDAIEKLLTLMLEFGLTRDEANGLVKCWKKQFFETEGRRFLTILSKQDYDAMCPIKIRPKPTELVRLGIVLTEF